MVFPVLDPCDHGRMQTRSFSDISVFLTYHRGALFTTALLANKVEKNAPQAHKLPLFQAGSMAPSKIDAAGVGDETRTVDGQEFAIRNRNIRNLGRVGISLNEYRLFGKVQKG